MIFKDDPEQLPRDDDSLLSWSMKMFFESEDKNPELYAIFPMAKSVLLATKAVSEFAVQKDMVDKDVGFFVTGASKRG